MFNLCNKEAIKTIREWLDDISYSTLNRRMMQILDQTDLLYSDFNKFMGIINRINPIYAFVFSIFRFGQLTERAYLDTFLPANVIDALIDTGLLLHKGKYYQMPEVGILPLGGMYFVAGLPEVYPTVSRNNRYKPIDYSAQTIMDEMVSQSVGTDFLEYHADYGILANMAAMKGCENISILPKHADYVPFIQLNLALNNHIGEVITRSNTSEYNLIAGINLSVKEKTESMNLKISDEEGSHQLFPVFRKLKESGQALLLFQSLGTIGKIKINDQLKSMDGFNIKSVVIDKVPHQSFLLTNIVQSSWEKKFELVPCEYMNYVQNIIESLDGKAFVFTQLLQISRQKTDELFILFPFYNPIYSDPIFNYASLTV